MNQFIFTPDQSEAIEVKVPFIEDARADFAPYYDNRMDEKKAESQVAAELAKLGGYVVGFHKGKFRFDEGERERHGYQIKFTCGGAPGVIRVAGLPIQYDETERKVKMVRIQALLNVRDWLKSAVTMKVFAPGTSVLLPHLLLPDGETTIADFIISHGQLPQLAPSNRQEIIVEETVS